MSEKVIHLYKMRHVFIGDEYAGKYDAASKRLVIVRKFKGEEGRVRAFFKGRLGICPRGGEVTAEARRKGKVPSDQ